MDGVLRKIWIKRARRGTMDSRQAAVLREGAGIEGNADQRGRRQVTLLDEVAWNRAVAGLNADLDPSIRRANLLVSGLTLANSRGKLLAVGEAVIEIAGETRPCERMEEALSGLQSALRPDWGGGAYGFVVRGGDIQLGDRVSWVDSEQ